MSQDISSTENFADEILEFLYFLFRFLVAENSAYSGNCFASVRRRKFCTICEYIHDLSVSNSFTQFIDARFFIFD